MSRNRDASLSSANRASRARSASRAARVGEPAPDLVERAGGPAAQVGQPGLGLDLGQQLGQGHPRLVQLPAGQLLLALSEAVARFQPPPCDALVLAPGLGTHDGGVPQQARDEDHQGEQADGGERGRRRAASGPLQPRSQAGVRRARIGSPARKRPRSSASASARRSAGAAPSPGTSGRSSPGRAGPSAGAARAGPAPGR